MNHSVSLSFAVILALSSMTVIAHGNDDNDAGGNALQQTQSQRQYQSSSATTNGAPTSLSSVSNSRLQIPAAPSAIAPSVAQYDPCPVVSPKSHGFSTFLGGYSATDGVSMNAICIAWHLKQFDMVQAMACELPEYKKAALSVGVSCK